MSNLLFFYLLIGVFTSAMIYERAEEFGLTGEHILSILPLQMRLWFRANNGWYKASVVFCLILIVLLWPIALIWTSDNDEFWS